MRATFCKMEQKVIEISLWPDGNGQEFFLIVKHKTGITFVNQIRGHSWCKNSCEGYVIPFRSYKEIDHCKLLHLLWNDEGKNKANQSTRVNALPYLNKFLIEVVEDISPESIKGLTIDESRLDELIEGWWPIKGQMILDDNEWVDFIGYLTIDNCD